MGSRDTHYLAQLLRVQSEVNDAGNVQPEHTGASL